MDKLDKALKKLTEKERHKIREILIQLKVGSFKNLDIKKLKGREDIFRVRKGDLRIIYRIVKESIFVLAIERRSEKTYKGI